MSVAARHRLFDTVPTATKEMVSVVEAESERVVNAVVRRVQMAVGGHLDSSWTSEFVETYLRHLSPEDILEVGEDTLVGLLVGHLRIGKARASSETLLDIYTPTLAEHGWDAGGSTVIQAVTGDREFLVDTFTMSVTALGWAIREVFHPQLAVQRDGSGEFRGLSSATMPGIAESWICLEVFPALGSSASDGIPELKDLLLAGIDQGEAALADHPAMRAAMLREIDALRALPPTPELARAVDLLTWLVADNFVFLGFREYTFNGTFEALPGSGLGIRRGVDDPDVFHAYPGPRPPTLVITKDTQFSPVHRRAQLDYLGIRRYDPSGAVVGEARFVGLFATSAYVESASRIPGLDAKVEDLLQLGRYEPSSYGYARLRLAIETYPRDELFQASADELFPIIDQVAAMLEKRQVRVFVRPSVYRQSVSVMVYLPRDRYVTSVRFAIQELLLRATGGVSLTYQAQVSESVIARLFFVVRLPDDSLLSTLDVYALEASIAAACQNWDDNFNTAAVGLTSEQRGVEFSEGYQSDYSAAQGVADLRLLNRLTTDGDMEFSVAESDEIGDIRLKVFTAEPMSLATAMPHLANLGAAVVDERPYDVTLRGRPLKVYDFGLDLPGGAEAYASWTRADRTRFVQAFEASYRGKTASDALNNLVVSGSLTWRQVAWLRAVSRYLQQAGVAHSQQYIASALTAHAELAALLVDLFETKFDPRRDFADTSARLAAVDAVRARFHAGLSAVESLDHDRILRRFESVLDAVVRTNAFQPNAEALALKLHPRELSFLPEPRPLYEIFVHSPRVTGTHLRFGKVARGGLRWSDRIEDFRTEVLGLVKAQAVKNTVIVPDGAKGGFVPLCLPPASAGRAAIMSEGIAAYRVFISSLLSVTDNKVGQDVVSPDLCVAYDDPDPYLVVAADKGTATFSDIANQISLARGFWLGDAFASGGSAGYDHKAMGITARGAWESAKEHFAAMGIDPATTDFTAVGIGDMSGDVFGNGMLRSPHTRLVAAFNHLHVFIDPNPDAAASFAERQRLFSLPRSTWADYDSSLISTGGGVYPRTAKSVPLTPEAKAALGIESTSSACTPAELVSAILRAPVDLLFNGGIGTYVRGADESDAQVGDKANDAVRITGAEVRARSACEGGNLGWTQRGRMEYAAHGGRVNTDFIDNSAGVDTSDHEVNIKVLLSGPLAAGELDLPARNELLASMTDEIAQHVLQHNVAQNGVLTDAEHQGIELTAAYEALMVEMSERGLLDRRQESLPSATELAARAGQGRGLTRPELAVLLAHTKLMLKQEVMESDLPEDPFLIERLFTYFPKALRAPFHDEMLAHPLAREIITTVTANRFIDSQGITAFHRLQQETSTDVADIVRSQLAARSLIDAAITENGISESSASYQAKTAARGLYRRAVERTMLVLLHTRRLPLDVSRTVGTLLADVQTVRASLPAVLPARFAARAQQRREGFLADGLATDLAERLGVGEFVHFAAAVAQLPAEHVPVTIVGAVYFDVMEKLSLDVLYTQTEALPRTGRWDMAARAAQRDDLLALMDDLTMAVLATGTQGSAEERVQAWLERTPRALQKAASVAEASAGDATLAQVAVGLRQARSLVQGGQA